ncbi:MAG: cation:proton antiporter, partial [Candidatus Binatia bacterium]
MTFILWLIVAGGLFIFTALAGSLLKRLPLTVALLYLAVGFGLGPAGVGLLHLDPLQQAGILERITEVAVLISLFSAGLKLRMPLSEGRWLLPVRLAFLSMTFTVGLIAAVGVLGLGMPLGASILLGAILAPTDPVLASDVQVEHPWDRDRLRFSLTGEAGLNDGTAFPFVMLGLGLLGLHEIGVNGYRWLVVDVVWAITGGLGIGALLGTLVGQVVLYLRREHQEAVGRDDFLALGLVALSYGSALLAQTYGFLAVFAAGLALRRVELWQTGEKPPNPVRMVAETGQAEEIATNPKTAPAYMAQAVLSFNEQLERSAEMGAVVLLGGMLSAMPLPAPVLWFVPLFFLVIRPAAVWLGLLGSRAPYVQQGLMAWFGIRGIGSIYYLM